VISDRRLAPSGLGPTAALVPAGHRAVAVPVGGAVPPLAVGDRVDLLTNGSPATGFLGTGARSLGDGLGERGDTGGQVRAVVRDVAVLDIGADAITVVVPTDQLPAVIAATQGSVVVPVLAGN
jgi:hypothetical protein